MELATIPAAGELESLSDRDLFALDAMLEEVQPYVRELCDAKLRHWVEVEELTLAEVGRRVGLTPQAISKRCQKAGVEPPRKRRPRKDEYQPVDIPADEEYVEGEIVRADTGAVEYVSDLVAPDAYENLRTQVVRWYEQGARVEELLTRPLDSKSPGDKKALLQDARRMERIAQQIQEVLQ